MIDLRGPDGVNALCSLRGRRLLYAFDFDGTLAPLAPHPDDVELDPAVAEQLKALAALAPVAILSGRARKDVMGHLPFAPAFIVGNHGMEGLGEELPARPDVRKWFAYLAQRLESSSQAWVEDKRWSLSVHCADQTLRRSLQKEWDAAGLPSMKIIEGTNCVNILPPGSPTKGDALLRLMEKTAVEAAVFAGDEETDESIFALEDPRIFSIRIGRNDASKARFFLPAQQSIDWLLEKLLGMTGADE